MTKSAQKNKKKKKYKDRVSYSQDVVDELCQRIAEGESMRSVVSDKHMPETITIYRWLRKYDDFAKQYAQARIDRADTLADEAQAIIDEEPPLLLNGKIDPGWVTWQRNRVDTRKWFASKLKPAQWGEKLGIGNADDDKPFEIVINKTFTQKD